MGEKSVDNLLAGIEASKQRPLARVLAALNIRHVGNSTAELLANHFGDIDALRAAEEEALQAIDGIGPEVAGAVRTWAATAPPAARPSTTSAGVGVNFTQPRDAAPADVPTHSPARPSSSPARSKTTVPREEIEALIKRHGGKATGRASARKPATSSPAKAPAASSKKPRTWTSKS
jgi:DNA ligase (NAD+)